MCKPIALYHLVLAVLVKIFYNPFVLTLMPSIHHPVLYFVFCIYFLYVIVSPASAEWRMPAYGSSHQINCLSMTYDRAITMLRFLFQIQLLSFLARNISQFFYLAEPQHDRQPSWITYKNAPSDENCVETLGLEQGMIGTSPKNWRSSEWLLVRYQVVRSALIATFYRERLP